jgi:hypothetical protein
MRAKVKSFVRDICKDAEFDVLCWGAQLSESTVQAVLNGTNTKLSDVSNVLRAAGFHLRLVLVHEEQQLVIGDKQFETNFAQLHKQSHREVAASKEAATVNGEQPYRTAGKFGCNAASLKRQEQMLRGDVQPNSWNLLLGDLQ